MRWKEDKKIRAMNMVTMTNIIIFDAKVKMH